MRRTSLLLAGLLVLTTQGWAQSCASESALVTKLRGWVDYDIQLHRSTLLYNKSQLQTAIESWERCQPSDVKKALVIIKDFANSICTTPLFEQRRQQLELSGEAKANLKTLLGKLANIDLGGAAKYTSQGSQGVLQTDLAKAIKDGNDCRLSVFFKLIDKLMPPEPPAGDRTTCEIPVTSEIDENAENRESLECRNMGAGDLTVVFKGTVIVKDPVLMKDASPDNSGYKFAFDVNNEGCAECQRSYSGNSEHKTFPQFHQITITRRHEVTRNVSVHMRFDQCRAGGIATRCKFQDALVEMTVEPIR